MNSETKKTLKTEVSNLDIKLRVLRTETAQKEVTINNLLRSKKDLDGKIRNTENKKKEIVEDLQKE